VKKEPAEQVLLEQLDEPATERVRLLQAEQAEAPETAE
jgi:hypothetical protein